jgi:hypothetical protein
MTPLFMHYKLTSQADVRQARRASKDNDAGALEPKVRDLGRVVQQADVGDDVGF